MVLTSPWNVQHGQADGPVAADDAGGRSRLPAGANGDAAEVRRTKAVIDARNEVNASHSAMGQVGDRVGNSTPRERMRERTPRRLAADQRSQRECKPPSIGGESKNTRTSVRRRKSGRTRPGPRKIA